MYCAVVPYLEMFCEDQTVVGEETSLVQKQLPQVGRPAETGSTWALLTQARVALGFQCWLPLRSGLGKWISEVVSKQRGRCLWTSCFQGLSFSICEMGFSELVEDSGGKASARQVRSQ